MKKLISPGLSPNLEFEDVLLASRTLLTPFSYKFGDSIAKVEAWFKYNYDTQYAFTFSSAREGLYAIFSAFDIEKDDEIILQAFTCSAVVEPILWIGAKPIFVDISAKNLSMDHNDLIRKITDKTKAIILQHTFAIPGAIEKVQQIAKEKKILLIEDCAHTIGGSYQNKKLGMFSDTAIFSFGRDKAISSVFGGAVITNKKRLAERLKKIEELTPFPSYFWICQQLFHPILTFFVLKAFLIDRRAGSSVLSFLKKLHILSRPIQAYDALSLIGKGKIKRLPNALAKLALSQLIRSPKFNKRRKEICTTYINKLGKKLKEIEYDSEIPYLRFPMLISSPLIAAARCKKDLIYMGDWYSHIIDPKGTDLSVFYYQKGSCLVAERIASKIINLPCYPTMSDKDVQRVISHFI